MPRSVLALPFLLMPRPSEIRLLSWGALKNTAQIEQREREAGDFIFGSSLFGVFGIFLEEEKGRRRRQNNDRDYLGALLSSQPACVRLHTCMPTIDTEALLFSDL